MVDRHAIDPDLSPWLSVDPYAHVEYVRELEDMVSVTPAGDRTLEAKLLNKAWKFLEARGVLEEMVAQGIGGADTMNSLAWLLATCPDERVRDGRRP